LWNCYKASCNVSGKKRVHLSVEDIQTTFSKTVESNKENDFILPEYVVDRKNTLDIISWCAKWAINADDLDLYYDVKEHRVVFPIYKDNVIVDAIGRSLGKRLPKWKKYGNSGLPFSFGCGKVAVVVEDCVSAAVVGSDVFVGVAVLGTSLSEIHKKYIAQFSTAIIALDPDALPKTLSFAKELRGHVKDVRVLKLKDDLKYRNKIDLDNLNNLTPKEKQTWNFH
jgi:DNA primase